jgi:hypothetical protein
MIEPFKNIMFDLLLHLQIISSYVWITNILISQKLTQELILNSHHKQLKQQNKF